MKTQLTIILVAAAVFAATIFLIIDSNRAAQDEVIRRFHTQQFYAVRHFVHEMGRYLRDRSQGAQVLSTFASVRLRNMKKMAADLQEYFEYVKKDHVKAISVYDEEGTIIYSTTRDAVGRNYARCDFFQWAAKEENNGKQFVSSLIRVTQNQSEQVPYFRFLIASPVYREARNSRHLTETHTFTGVLTVTIDLEEVIEAFLPLLGNSTSKQHIWIVDTSGTVLYQSEQPEMVMNCVRKRDETCTRCHISFDYVEKAVAEKEGTIDYALRERPKKSAAFAPLAFENVAWMIAVNVPFGEISSFLGRQLAHTLLLIGVISVSLAGGSALIYRSIRSKIRAEEETKGWKKKRELEEKIRESEERYRRLVEISPDAIAVHCEGKIAFVNPAAVKGLGAGSAEELVGKPVLEVVHPDDRGMVKRRIQAVLTEGKPAPWVEERFLRVDGNPIDVEVAAVATTYQDKPAVQVVVRDITARKQAEMKLRETQEEMQRIFDSSPNAILLIDLEGTILDCNQATVDLYGYSTKAELLGKSGFNLVVESERQCAGERLQELLARGTMRGVELTMLRRDGSQFGAETAGSVLYEPTGKPSGLIVITTDISERKRGEEALKESEQRFRSLTEFAITGVYLIQEGVFRYVNPVLATMFGYDVDEVVNKLGPLDLTAPEDHDVVAENIRRRVEGVIPQIRYPFKGLRKDGHCLDIEVHGARIEYNGKPAIIGTLLDITERKKAEERLAELNECLLSFGADPNENINRLVAFCGEQLQATCALYNRLEGDRLHALGQWHAPPDFVSVDKPEGHICYDVIRSGKEVIHIIHDLLHTSYAQTDPNVIRYGLQTYISKAVAVDGTCVGSLCVVYQDDRDLSKDDLNLLGIVASAVGVEEKRKQTEKRITMLAHAVRSINECVSVTDKADNILFVNDAFLQTYGYERGELQGKDISIVRSPNNPPPVVEEILPATIRGGWQGELLNRRKDGSEFPISLSTSVVRDDNGKPVALIGVAVDITERKRAEEALKESEERYRAIVETAPDVIYTLAVDNGKFTSLNPAFETLTGWSSSEWLGKSFVPLVHPDDRQVAMETFKQVLKGEHPSPYELRILAKSGEYLVGEFTSVPQIAGGKIVGEFGIARDITARKLAEEASRQAADEIGKAHEQLLELNKHLTEVREEERAFISREIHDELGQSLTAVKIDLDWVRAHLAKKRGLQHKLDAMLGIVKGTIKNVQRIASELRPGILDDLGLASAIEWYCEEFEKRTGVTCRTDLEEIQTEDPHKNLAVFRILQETLTNVIRHSYAKTVNVKLSRVDENIVLELHDDGIGISRDNIDSKKSRGLIGMRERANQFNGNFEISSEPGKGTTTRVTLTIHP